MIYNVLNLTIGFFFMWLVVLFFGSVVLATWRIIKFIANILS